MKLLILGDVVGEQGLSFLESKIQFLRDEYKFNMLIVNAENVTKGHGLSYDHYKRLMKLNISALTMGNHTFRQKEIFEYIDQSNIVRPYNIDIDHGEGYKVINFNGKKLKVINLLGKFAMECKFEISNPFIALNEILENTDKADYTIVDFHAEATSEKYALAHAFDGKVDLIYGTHTHVQTSDEQILPNKTLYITDVGMTGPNGGVLGVKKDIIINRMWHGILDVFETCNSSCTINGILVDLVTKKIRRINVK